MELSELTSEEEVVMMGLLREVVQADGEYSPEERSAVAELRNRLGPARFDQAIHKAQARYGSRAQLKEHAKTVARPEARRAIYDALVHVAAVDGLEENEEKPLMWLASWWDMHS